MSAQSIANAVLEKPAYCLRCKARDRLRGLSNARLKKQKLAQSASGKKMGPGRE
jgi:hypothetical protein